MSDPTVTLFKWLSVTDEGTLQVTSDMYREAMTALGLDVCVTCAGCGGCGECDHCAQVEDETDSYPFYPYGCQSCGQRGITNHARYDELKALAEASR